MLRKSDGIRKRKRPYLSKIDSIKEPIALSLQELSQAVNLWAFWSSFIHRITFLMANTSSFRNKQLLSTRYMIAVISYTCLEFSQWSLMKLEHLVSPWYTVSTETRSLVIHAAVFPGMRQRSFMEFPLECDDGCHNMKAAGKTKAFLPPYLINALIYRPTEKILWKTVKGICLGQTVPVLQFNHHILFEQD